MRTTKTGKIMSLIGEPAEQPKNPVVRIPEEDEIPVIFTKDNPAFQIINVTFLLINEQLGQVMERFHCCTCEKCISRVTAEALRNLPSLTVAVKRKSDADKVNRLAAEHRANVTKALTKAVMSVKTLPRH